MPWVRRHLWLALLVLGGVGVAAYYLAPAVPGWPVDPDLTQSVLWQVVGGLATVGILAAVAAQRPSGWAGWLLLAAAVALNVAGDAIWEYPWLVGMGEPLPSPSPADAFYLLSYVALAGGVVVLTRDRVERHEPAATLDALVVTAAAALGSWVLLVQPILDQAGSAPDPVPLSGTAVNVAYPLADLLVLAVAARLWFAVESGANRSLRLLLAGVVAALVTDTLFTAQTLAGQWVDGSWVDLGWFAFYVLLAAAAAHPSSAGPAVATTREQEAGSWRFVGLLALAVLVPMALLLALGTWSDTAEVTVVAVGGLLLLALVLTRLDGLLRQLRTTLQRERIMREANASLAAAADRESIRATALRAARELVPGSEVSLVAPLPNPTHGHAAVVVAAGDGARVGLMLDHGATELVRTAAAAHLLLDEPTELHRALSQPPDEVICVVGLKEHDRTQGFLIVSSLTRPSPDATAAVEALADAVALANARFDRGRLQADRQTERRVRRMLEHASDVIVVLDRELRVRYVTPVAEQLLGSPVSFLLGSSWLELVVPADRDTAEALITRSSQDRPTHGELRLLSAAGAPRYVDLVAAQVVDDEEPGFVLTCHDITERRALEQQLTHQAFHDSLTGLANRSLFTDRLERALARSPRSEQRCAVLFVDLDDFKDVNDSLGHAAGDDLLRQVTARLTRVLRDEDTAARLGGDEFALLVENADGQAGACAVAQRLIDSMGRPFRISGAEVTSSISVGIALHGVDVLTADEIMRNADLALYEAKNLGKDRYALFVPVMHEQALDRLRLTADLRHALDADELVVHYQPIVDLQSDQILGVEALVRWQHPQRGLLAPGHFIPLAEETGLVVPLGRQVMVRALRTAAGWQRLPGHEQLLVSVNLSARQLQHDDIVTDVSDALLQSAIDPATVLLEITESVLLPGEGVTIERLRALSGLGVQLFIDDFGTGYSSLSYLQQLPVHGIKLAREFVATLTEPLVVPGQERNGAGPAPVEPRGQTSSTGLVSTIRALAETLGLASIIAEGVETQEQRQALLDLGYRVGQGYLMAHPMPESDAAAVLAAPRVTASLVG